MAKYQCDRCDRSFKHPQGLGRHMTVHKKQSDIADEANRRAKPAKAPKAIPPSNGRTGTAIDAFEEATASLVAFVRSMEGALATYQRENEELRTFKQRASALFGPEPKVPRA